MAFSFEKDPSSASAGYVVRMIEKLGTLKAPAKDMDEVKKALEHCFLFHADLGGVAILKIRRGDEFLMFLKFRGPCSDEEVETWASWSQHFQPDVSCPFCELGPDDINQSYTKRTEKVVRSW